MWYLYQSCSLQVKQSKCFTVAPLTLSPTSHVGQPACRPMKILTIDSNKHNQFKHTQVDIRTACYALYRRNNISRCHVPFLRCSAKNMNMCNKPRVLLWLYLTARHCLLPGCTERSQDPLRSDQRCPWLSRHTSARPPSRRHGRPCSAARAAGHPLHLPPIPAASLLTCLQPTAHIPRAQNVQYKTKKIYNSRVSTAYIYILKKTAAHEHFSRRVYILYL